MADGGAEDPREVLVVADGVRSRVEEAVLLEVLGVDAEELGNGILDALLVENGLAVVVGIEGNVDGLVECDEPRAGEDLDGRLLGLLLVLVVVLGLGRGAGVALGRAELDVEAEAQGYDGWLGSKKSELGNAAVVRVVVAEAEEFADLLAGNLGRADLEVVGLLLARLGLRLLAVLGGLGLLLLLGGSGLGCVGGCVGSESCESGEHGWHFEN